MRARLRHKTTKHPPPPTAATNTVVVRPAVKGCRRRFGGGSPQNSQSHTEGWILTLIVAICIHSHPPNATLSLPLSFSLMAAAQHHRTPPRRHNPPPHTTINKPFDLLSFSALNPDHLQDKPQPPLSLLPHPIQSSASPPPPGPPLPLQPTTLHHPNRKFIPHTSQFRVCDSHSEVLSLDYQFVRKKRP